MSRILKAVVFVFVVFNAVSLTTVESKSSSNSKLLGYIVEGTVFQNNKVAKIYSTTGKKGSTEYKRFNTSLCTTTRSSMLKDKVLFKSWYNCEVESANAKTSIVKLRFRLKEKVLKDKKKPYTSKGFLKELKQRITSYKPFTKTEYYFRTVHSTDSANPPGILKLVGYQVEGKVYQNKKSAKIHNSYGKKGSSDYIRFNASLCTTTHSAMRKDKVLYKSWYSCEVESVSWVMNVVKMRFFLNENILKTGKTSYISKHFLDELKRNILLYTPLTKTDYYYHTVKKMTTL